MDSEVLRFESITREFPGVKALDDVSFSVNQGEVFALLGANGAGKSTLMNILGGNIPPSSGKIYIDSEEKSFSSPQDSLNAGIGFVHQEIALFPTMTIAENLFINGYKTNTAGLLTRKAMEAECANLLKKLNCNLSPRTLVKHLGTGDQQMLEIARALLINPRILILDEPTSSLTNSEKQRLFETIKLLKKHNVTVIYISHFLDEVFSICDRALVMRNGRYAGEGDIKDLSYEKIVGYMLGETESDIYYSRKHEVSCSRTVMEIENISRKGVLDNISFSVKENEVYGLWGLLGSGRTEFMEALAGLDEGLDDYKVTLKFSDESISLKPSKALNYFGYLTENRRENGLLLSYSILANISLANLRSYISTWPFVNDKKIASETEKYVEQLGIKISDLQQRVETLSGGNQQKVIIGKWIQRAPKILLLDEPTRGLDVGAKRDVHKIINDFVANGASVIFVSSDIDEMLNMCDRISVIDRGCIKGEFKPGVSKEKLMALASGATEE